MKKTTLKKSFVIVTSCLISAFSANAQFSFTNSNSLISNLTRSGCAISVVDINNDGLDDIVKMDQSDVLVIDLQNANGTFTNYDLGTITGGSNVWGMALADVDHNGWKDVATGTNGTMYLVKLSWTGTTIAKTTTTLAGSYFVQNITFGDINNDGWVDLAVCDDNDFMKIYKNNSGTMSLTTSLIDTEIYPGMAYGGDPYDSGNYGSVWLDFDNDGDLDLYIAHCRQSASSSSDQRRRDRLFVNNGSNVYTEQAATYGIEISNFKQTWTTSFGDLDNDGDFDVVMTNHGENGQILKNDGSGHFTDVTASTGWVTSIDPIESVVEDFDNDGFLDIMISGSQWYMWHNNGNMTFTPVTGVLPNLGGLLSFATGDLNHDGFIDLQTSYGNGYNSPSTTDNDVLYLNNKNSNHFITFNLTGTASNHDAIGAKVIITGAFGTQVREVRAGETYGTANSMQLHFGLGANTTITSAVIEWPAGGTTTFGTLEADQFVTAVEGTCAITGNVIPGPYTYCTGSSVVLTAQPGYSSYLWSNGSTAASVTSTSTSNYNVLVTSAAGCSNLSPTVSTVLNPPEIPLVSTSGVNSCAGTLTLTSSAAAAYSWTGPAGFTATTQAINPSVTGTYSLTTTGLCQNWTAAPTAVNVLAAPSPTGTGAAGPGPASFNISAAGSGGTLNWYDAATGGTLLGSGAAFSTPVISSTTNYYVDETTNYPGSIYNGGRSSGAGSNSSTLNAGLDFNVLAPCTLTSVKVYATTTGAKTIQLKNSVGTVLNSFTTASLPIDSSVITLNFPLTPGTGYRLTQSSATTPTLKRNNSGVTYPYTTPGFVSITNGYTGTTTSSAAYYFYYDWKITTPTSSCTSERVPVVATILTFTGISSLSENNGVAIYPNPASATVNVEFGYTMNSVTVIEINDVTGRLVKTESFENPVKGQIVSLNVSELNAGSYMITIKNNAQKLVQKLVLTK